MKSQFFYARVAVILTSILLINTISANVLPWENYSKYLPEKMPEITRQLRGIWICTVINLDWPSKEVIDIKDDKERIEKSKDELIDILDNAVEMNLNSVFFQVSPEGDAFYKSDIVPWSRYLTGTFGKDPGFDPLEFAIKEARKRNLEFHAWINPYRISMYTGIETIKTLDIEKSVYKQHPEWIRTGMGRFIVDPGIPEARQWVIDRVIEVTQKYDVDGIHFDDYFYYEKDFGEINDKETYYNYNKGEFSNIEDWRRNNTYLLVKEVSQKIKELKPWVKFGISPSGVWGNKKDGHVEGSNTNTDYTNYEKCFANTKKWVEEEIIDYIAPQVYFTFANPNASYGEVASWWSNLCEGKNVHLYIGQALYSINDSYDKYFNGENAVLEFSNQIKFNTFNTGIDGSIMFRAKSFEDECKRDVVNAIKTDLWPKKVLVPIMPWKQGITPKTPTQGNLEKVSNGNKLTWFDYDLNTSYYAVYRVGNEEFADIGPNQTSKKLIDIVIKKTGNYQEFVDTTKISNENVFYVVTALDRLHNESLGLKISKSISRYFNDVGKEYSWAVRDIDAFFERNIIKGVGQSKFSPGDNTKRGDFVLMIVRALNLQAEFADNFKDVSQESYYYDAVGISKKLGIAKGSGENFNPEGNITREDMTVIMVRALKAYGVEIQSAGEEYLKGYNDEHMISDYAKNAVATLTKLGVIKGYDSKVHPKDLATRAEIVVMLNRALAKVI